jgi:hypothetical protein
MSLIPSTTSTGLGLGLGWPPMYGSTPQPISTVSAATKGSSNVTASPNSDWPGFLTQENFNKFGPNLPVVSLETKTPLTHLMFDPKNGGETFDAAVLRAAGPLREKFGIHVPVKTLTPSTTTSPPPTTSSSNPPPESTAPPVLPGKYDHGVFVPDIKLLTNVVSNQTLGNTTFPLWIGLKGNYVPYPDLMTGVKPKLRGRDRTKVFKLVGYSVVIEPVENMPMPNKPNEYDYDNTIARYYVSKSCNFEDPENCVMMCGDYADVEKYFKLVNSSKITLIGGGNKNVYSRRKLNKTKSKRKTTKRLRSRSLRSRRNIIRKTKKMYK